MAGETKRTYATKQLDTGSKQQDEGTAREQFSNKALKGSSEHYQNGSLEPRAIGKGSKFLEKDRDNTQQREAVIRPQQTGKIDFKSLQNRPKFASDRTWPSGKGSPQSPSGKSRSRDKGKKSGKAERGNPQQLYRLSITNPRSNPTIGIAYPQQKVSPPKKLETNRGPVSGSYRFHVPSIPEREAELQQEELNYNRCFQEGSPNLTSPSYTSQAAGSAGGPPTHQHPPSTQQQPQQPGPLENSSAQPGNQMLFSDFQLNGTDAWQSPERTFNGGNYGISSQKSNVLMETNKANGSFVPMSFQYGFSLLDDSSTEPFPCDQPPQSQDYMDTSLASNQVTHSSFPFQSSGDGQEVVQNNTQFNNEQTEARSPYPLPSKPPQYLQAPHGAPSSMHCPRSMSEDASIVESSVSSSHQSEQSKSALPDKSDTYCQVDNRDVALAAVSKRSCHPKDSTANQRILIQGSVHHIRNIAQGPGSQMHFPSKAYSSPPLNAIHMGSVPLDKSINKTHGRLPQPWDGPNKVFPPMEQNSVPYSTLSEKYPFQCQPVLDQRQSTGKNSRMPWQQMRLSSAMPNQNMNELSRQLSNQQQLTFLIAPSDWQDDSKSHKNSSMKSSSTFQNKRPSEGFPNPRQDSIKQNCNIMPACPFNNKVETSHGQVCDSKSKSVYFGMSQSMPGASSRNCNYTPLQVPPMGMMLVSPYESPLPSPIQNPASSSTCSSLSPASTSPVNSSSDDNQMSKAVPPPLFYHQHQGKSLTASDHLNSNPHHFHPEASRTLPYAPERSKEDILSFLQNNRHPKPNMEASKGCMDSYGMEHHPPPPYSAHQLLATSLATANLDQLDVLLTCKQCDHNFTNLASFLDHKQYCGQHAFAQNDFKDVPKMEDTRKFQIDPSKASSSGTNYSMSRCPSDLHLSLLGLSKNGELMSDNEIKGDTKDDPLKLNLFSGTGHPPISLPDLEMEDAKLDSLITEALNGLGYQSDNAEIDSSFIDAFVDDELTTAKCTSNRQTLKTKDSMMFESRSKHEATSNERSQTQGKYPYYSDVDSLSTDSKHTESILKETHQEQGEKTFKEETTRDNARGSSLKKSREDNEWVKETRKSEKTVEESTCSPRFLLSRKFSERCGRKSFQESSTFVKSTPSQSSTASRSSTTQRLIAMEGKRKRTGGGTWSKELIHKIVQQKNKLHKLHVKGTKNMQFSLVMERLTPTVQNPTFREYDYVSDSDEDCEPVKIASQGRLSQSIRCKYTYTKECKGRARSDKGRESPWKQEKNECFEAKKAEDMSPSQLKESSCHQRLRRRSSRSSTSSDLSTSVSLSSDSISSPKSTDRTDSDSEKKVEVRRKDSDSFEHNWHERSPHRTRKDSNTTLALSFSKNTKRYSTEKIVLSANKDDSTTSKCSNINIRNVETVTEFTATKNTVSLARFKNTGVPSEEKEDYYNCETDIVARTEEPTPLKKDGQKNSLLLKGPDSTLYPAEAMSSKESSCFSKYKKDDSLSKAKTMHKRGDDRRCLATHPDSETSAIVFDKLSHSVNPTKEPSNFPSDSVSQSSSLCNSLVDEVCLSPTNFHDPATQKETIRHGLIPYPLEQEQSLIKSPLSFDTSSMFGDLTVSGFDNNLYTDIQLNKDGFSSLESTSDKKELFESSFSTFLEQRDWGLMVDVTPVLPDEISQFKDDSDMPNEKKANYSHVPFSLPEKIMDYNANLNSVSEDELEIKRIVTELESQLQTAKLSSSPLLDGELPKQLTMSKFSPLRLDHEAEDEQSGLDVDSPAESIALAVPSMPTDSHPELFSEPDLPWASPLQFGLIEGQQCLHTPTHSDPSSHENITLKDGTEHNIMTTEEQSSLHIDEKAEGADIVQSPATDKSEEMLENEKYAENLMKSLEVISDSIFKKSSLTAELEESNITQLPSPEQPQKECEAAGEDQSGNEAIPNVVTESLESTEYEVDLSLSKTIEYPPDANEALSLNLSESITSIVSGSDSNDIPVTEDITNIDENHSNSSLNRIDSQLDNPQKTEEACESHLTEYCGDEVLKNKEDSSKPPELLISTADQHEEKQQVEDCKWSVRQPELEEVDLDTKLDVGEPDSEEIPKDRNDSEACHVSSSSDGLKEDTECVKDEIGLTGWALGESDSISLGEEVNQAGPPKASSPEHDASNTTEIFIDDLSSPQLTETDTELACHRPTISNTEETDSEKHMQSVHSEHDGIQENDIDMATTPEQLAKAKEDQDSKYIFEQTTPAIIVSPLLPTCSENIQDGEGQNTSLEAMPPLSPPLPSSLHASDENSAMQDDQSQLQCTWDEGDKLTPALINGQSPKEESSDDPNVGETLHNCESSTISELDHSFVPHLDFKTTESEICSPEKVLAETSIPDKLPLAETTEHSETLKTLPNGDTLYEFKLSPLNYNDISDGEQHFNEYGFSSVAPNKGMVEQSTESSPKDNHDSYPRSLEMPLSSNNRLSPIHGDSKIELSSGPDNLIKLSKPDIALHSSTIQDDSKCSCMSLACTYHKESVSSIDDEKLTKIHQDDMDTCHAPLETIDYMDLHINLLKKADIENLDIQIPNLEMAPCEHDALSLRQSMSDDPGTLQAQLSCAEDLPTVHLHQIDSLISKEGQCTKHTEVKTSPKKNSTQHTAQGKFQCEVCSMYFRTVPGLKRHKAMKHLIKTDGSSVVENITMDNQGSVSIYQRSHSSDTEQKDDKGRLDPMVCLHTESDGIAVKQGDQGELALIFQGTASESSMLGTPENKDKERVPAAIEKAKKNYKVRKNKNSDVNNGCFVPKLVKPDPFPDELLSILKTDILQAISPDFPSMGQQGCSKSPEKQDTISGQNDNEVKVIEKLQDMVASSINKKVIATYLTEQPNLYNQGMAAEESDGVTAEVKSSNLPEMLGGTGGACDAICKEYDVAKEHLYDMKEVSEQQINLEKESTNTEILGKVAVEIKCERNSYPSDDVDTLSCCFKDPPSSPSGLGTDLKALLDDESTFSQLFPRNEEMKRKKCPRVYGKSNKKHKLAPSLPLVQDYPASDIFIDKTKEYKENKINQMFVNNLNDHCEYETISIDDAIMLDMCHKSAIKSSVEKICNEKDDVAHHQGDSYEETREIGIRDFLCQTEDNIRNASMPLDGSKDIANIVTKSGTSPEAQKTCKTEVPATPCPLQLAASCAPYSETPCAQDNVSHYPNIDIQNLNTTFQLPEIQFFESGKDIPVVGTIITKDAVIRDPARPSKKPTERRGRKRIEAGLKPKDKQYKCKVCFTWFLTLGELNFHKLSHNPSPPPTCYMCVQRKFSSREQLRDHLREKHAKNKAGIWTCGMCLKEISDVWMYNEHLREHATQFARKGQTQSSILDMPGCFMQENAVKNFITSIMQHRPSKSSKGESGKASSKEEKKATVDVGTGQEPKTVEGGEPTTVKMKGIGGGGGGGKQSTLTPVEVLHKAETAPKNAEMHPNCKDPSRDCHHCGKQFPKPFKLQRHLVVHSLQKIFLCHKCPVSYQEAKDLKDHLKSEHEEMDEPDSKHTTLYTCELCADVMHVIKKSFICSTCNYTFSKKEQFDRHMEKHLAGGNKVFKFRGVLRPSKSSNSKDDEFDMPPNKKRKILTESLQENSSDSGIASIASLHFGQSADMHVPKPTLPIVGDPPQTNTAEQPGETKDASVKIEDVAEDFSGILGQLPQCRLQMASAEQTCPSNTIPKTENKDSSPSHKLPASEVSEDDSKALADICEVKIEDDSLCSQKQPASPSSFPTQSSVTKDEKDCTSSAKQYLIEANTQTSLAEEKNEEIENLSNMQVYAHPSGNTKHSQAPYPLNGDDLQLSFTKQQSPLSMTNQMREEKPKEPSANTTSRDNEKRDLHSSNGAEQQASGQTKVKPHPKSGESNKHSPENSPRPGCLGPTEVHPTKIIPFNSVISDDKDFMRQQKKRKELRTPHSSQRVSSPARRENLGIDTKVKKKFRPSKCESTAGLRKADGPIDYSVLSSVRDETVSNKIVSKHKVGTLGLQPKRISLDNCPPKKAEIVRHSNGDCKGKKGGPGRPIHSPTSKVSVSSMNNSLNKFRPKAGVRSVETHSYRTAESQNHLLSQLFGQKLTSFKIPLRKDTSESIN